MLVCGDLDRNLEGWFAVSASPIERDFTRVTILEKRKSRNTAAILSCHVKEGGGIPWIKLLVQIQISDQNTHYPRAGCSPF